MQPSVYGYQSLKEIFVIFVVFIGKLQVLYHSYLFCIIHENTKRKLPLITREIQNLNPYNQI